VKNTGKTINAFCVAGTSSGSGKTTVSLALMRALRKRKLTVQPFKCGPDYIDPSYHHIAAETLSRNLDCRMMGRQQVERSFARAVKSCDCAVVEGVMGLYDAAKPDSIHGSTAETAILLKLPVLLTVDAKGMAGSIAAMVKGYVEFHNEINIVGVIANKVGSTGHAELLRKALTAANLPPLVGFLPRDARIVIPERHLGLVPQDEMAKEREWFDALAEVAEHYFDIELILELSQYEQPVSKPLIVKNRKKLRMAIARDEAFSFYYQDNLELLRVNGFELVEFSPLYDEKLPDADIVYIGGGFPEMFAEKLEKNSSMRESVKVFAENDGAIYAECGGFMYLTKSIEDCEGKSFQMCGVLPGNAKMNSRSRALGYRDVETVTASFWGEPGTAARGHEFHWSEIVFDKQLKPAWNSKSSADNAEWKNAGIQMKSVVASYIHLHFASNPQIIENLYQTIVGASSKRSHAHAGSG